MKTIVLFINMTSQIWSAGDFKTYEQVNIRCNQLYGVGVSRFEKHPDNHYNVRCGKLTLDTNYILDTGAKNAEIIKL